MRKQTVVVFDDFIAISGAGNQIVYTTADLNDLLGAYDKIAVQGIMDQVTYSATTATYTVASQQSGDGRNWSSKTDLSWGTIALVTNAVTLTTGADAGTTPSMGQVRLVITLATSGGAGTAQFHLKLIATLRDEA